MLPRWEKENKNWNKIVIKELKTVKLAKHTHETI